MPEAMGGMVKLSFIEHQGGETFPLPCYLCSEHLPSTFLFNGQERDVYLEIGTGRLSRDKPRGHQGWGL